MSGGEGKILQRGVDEDFLFLKKAIFIITTRAACRPEIQAFCRKTNEGIKPTN